MRRAALKGLSRALAWAAERLAAAAEPAVPAAAVPRRRPSQVLVVDDDVATQRAAIVLLASLDLRATAAGSGDEALGMLRGLRFDLILLDCDMPVMDGPDTARAIRGGAAGAGNAVLPIIGMAANVANRGPHGLVAGMNRVLPKPLSSEQLAPAIREVLGMAAEPPEPVAVPDLPATPAAAAGKRLPPAAAAPATASAATVPPVLPIFDPQFLLDDYGEDREFSCQIVVATRSELPKRLNQLNKAVAAADWEKAQHLVGIMESQATQIGGCRLAARLAATEGRLRDGERLDAQGLLELRLAVNELDDALRGWA